VLQRLLNLRLRTIVGSGLVLSLPAAAALSAGLFGQQPGSSELPRLLLRDPRLQMSVFASNPQVMTPIGIAVDGRDRVFVLESHTHLQPAGYPGPRGDLVKIFTDANRDGNPERVTTFAEGIEDGMNIRFAPSGELYVVTSRSVIALHDRDGDDVSEARTPVLQMVKPERVYDHAALLGLAFSPDGWLYVSRGNTGGAAWRIEGWDGSAASGYGDGGNILKCRPDGSELQEFATGFWNPFELQFDAAGRLLATDNDPDSRGPNRLVHVIQGGDYGYKSLYGNSGIHPYLSWNGELPGTLPYAAALGEAPAGMQIGATAALPLEYRDDVLAAIWEERTIVRVRLGPRGASLAGTAAAVVEGGEGFRPVAFAADSQGTVYITDWVKRHYPNHGLGRVWRLTTVRGVETLPQPSGRAVAADQDPLAPIYGASAESGVEPLLDALRSRDPFVRGAAVAVLARPAFRERLPSWLGDPDPAVRLGVVMALHRGGPHPDREALARRALGDADPQVRRMALIWVGAEGMVALEGAIEGALGPGIPSDEMFQTYLATLEHLSPEFIRAQRAEAEPYARLLKRVLRPRFLETFIADERRPAALRALAIAGLAEPAKEVPLLARLTTAEQPLPLRIEAVRSLALLSHDEAAAALLAVARNTGEPEALRAEALAGLAGQPAPLVDDVLPLLRDRSATIRTEAARHLRSVQLSPPQRRRVARAAAGLPGEDNRPARAQLAFVSGPAPRPMSRGEWEKALGRGIGDPDAGRRVFFSKAATCAACHSANRRGGDLGPDLTNVGRSKSRAQLLDAILRPSAEISPEYQGWFVRTADGQLHSGRQIDVGDGGEAELYVLPGRFVKLQKIADYGPMPQSLMPEGLDRALTVQDMRDLLAFLREGAGNAGVAASPARGGVEQ
jgi:putative membrane-bound dehydrogenase-like protein